MGLDYTAVLQPVLTKTLSSHGLHDKPIVHFTARLVGYFQSDNVHRLSTSAEFGAKTISCWVLG